MIKTNDPLSSIVYDVIVIGAGMSGSLLALALLKNNPQLNVLLVDENAERHQNTQPIAKNPSFDARCLALNVGSVDILSKLGLWENIVTDAQPIEHIQISDKGSFGALELTAETHLNAFGYVVELQSVGNVLACALAAFPTLTTLYNATLTNIHQSLNTVSCELNNGQTVTAKLCVGADGTHSHVRQLTKIESSISDYQRSAVIANVRCSQLHQNIAFERFTKDGPIALLPLTGNRYSLVYCVKNDDVDRIKALSDADFLTHLQQEFGYRAGMFEQTGKRDTYPLILMKTQCPIAHRIVCIGNAAHSLHPVAGQGFNLGLRDLFVLAKVVAESDPAKIGCFSMLRQYWQYRQKDHHRTILMTDSLVRIFSNEYHALKIPRNIALQGMSLLPFLSNPIIEQAKGQFDLFNRENVS